MAEDTQKLFLCLHGQNQVFVSSLLSSDPGWKVLGSECKTGKTPS